jgi:1D-myo-inositol 3-kinase
MKTSPDFLAIGHVTKDLLPTGGYTIGGTATYASLAAHKLGLAVAVLTSTSPDLDLRALEPGIQWQVVPAATATTFENIYQGERREQFVHGTASPLKATQLPELWKGAKVVLLCPVAAEIGLDWLATFPTSLIGVTPQGWMRQWDHTGRVRAKPWSHARQVLSKADVLVFSEDDVQKDEAVIQRYAQWSRIAVVTHGARGASVHWDGAWRDFPAFEVEEVEATGAGDVFAASFLVRLRETGDPAGAANFANAAASFAVEGPGVTTIADRGQVEERLRHGRLRR